MLLLAQWIFLEFLDAEFFLEVIPAHEAVLPVVLAVQAASHAASDFVRNRVVFFGDAFHRNAEVEFAVHNVNGFANLHIRDMAYVDHGCIHADASENRAELSANENKALVVFAAEVTVAVTDCDGCDARELLGCPVTAVANSFARLHVVHVADGGLDFHDRLDRQRGRDGTHAVVAVKREARAHHVKVTFGVRERACRTGAMADGRAESVCIEHIDESRKALNLNFCFRVARHVGSSEMREHAFELEMLEAESGADVVEVLSVKAVAIHARVNGEVRLAFRTGFTEELVEGDCRAEVRDGGGQLVFDKVRKVRRRARTEHENRQVHAVLAKQHAFADVGNAEVVSTAELSGKRAGEASVAVRVGLDREQNLCGSRNLASDKLNVVAESV